MSLSIEQNYQDTMRAIEQSQGSNGLRQFISFRVGSEDYAIDILSVREIKGWSKTTTLPSQPEYVRGVLNLRGAIVPVFDLGCRFGKGMTEASDKHVVIIVAVNSRLVGLLVDMVSDILSVPESTIGPIPETDASVQVAFLEGIISINETMVVILNLNTLFENLNAVSEASTAFAAA